MNILDINKRQENILEREIEIKSRICAWTQPDRNALSMANEIYELAEELVQLRAEYRFLGKLKAKWKRSIARKLGAEYQADQLIKEALRKTFDR